ncbi:MAG: hypothetical protein HYX66_09820 [Ignavibacteria bacterium]|nr:hypothetical protein [Ignavibacteria bacterium]
MTSLFKYLRPGLTALFVVLALAANAQEPQRFRTYFLDFQPISVGDTAAKDLVIDGFMGPGNYAVQKPLVLPFTLLTQQQDLVIRNGQLRIRVRFTPVAKGSFLTDLILIGLQGIPQTSDTLRIRTTGTSYFVARNVLIDFGRVYTGLVRLDSIRIRPESQSEGMWFIEPPGKPDAPFFLLSIGANATPSDDSAFAVFRFAPAKEGLFRDTLRAIRRHQGISLDTITVYLIGRGVDLDTTIRLSFGSVLTGDSVYRRRVFIQPPTHIYEIEYKPDDRSPFNVFKENINQTDSIAAIISFTPQKEQLYKDSVVLRRVRIGTAGVFDRIVIWLDGSGAVMQKEARVTFSGVRVNDVVEDTLELLLDPKPISAPFSYKLDKYLSGYITGSVSSPIGSSKANEIRVTFTAAPKTFANTSEKFVLYRMSKSGNVFDSTAISVATTMAARPIQLSLKVEEDTLRMRIGETAMLRIILSVDGEADKPLELVSITGRISYNPTVVVPKLTDNVRRVIDGDKVYIEFTSALESVVVNNEGNVVAEMELMAVIGDTDRTRIQLDGWSVVSSDKTYEVENLTGGMVLITNPWRYSNGNSRFVNSLQGALKLDINPNPIVSSGVMRIDNVTSGVGELTIVDVNGTLIADLTQQLRTGTREFELNKGAGSGVVLSPGSYYARLLVRGIDGSSINSVVRLLIVQ